MTRFDRPTFLTPPREEEEIDPYRPVWSSVIVLAGGVFAATTVIFFASSIFGLSFPENAYLPINITFALIPTLLWLTFSRLRERFAAEPRRNLLSVFVVSALAANAIGLPLIAALDLDQWLTLSGAIDRVIGYTVTVGVIQEALKYLVVRYIAFNNHLRIRVDAVAYCVASAIGYAMVQNLQLILDNAIAPDVTITRVYSNIALHLAASVLVAYGVAELRFNRRSLLIMPIMLIAASSVHGIGIVARSGFINASFFLGVAGVRPIFGLAISTAIILGGLILSAFLLNAAEREDREAAASREA